MTNAESKVDPELRAEMAALLRPFMGPAGFGVVLGLGSGAATAWLLATINQALQSPGPIPAASLLGFAALSCVSIAGSAWAGSINSAIGQKVIAALRKTIAARIVDAPLATLEHHKPYRLSALMTNDVDAISAFAVNAPSYAIALAVVVGSFVYLLSLSVVAFLLSSLLMGLGVVIHGAVLRVWLRQYEQVRDVTDDLHKQYRAITEGAKELKMNRARRRMVLGMLLSGAADRIADRMSRAMRMFWLADGSGAALFFVTVGLLLTMRSWFGIASGTVSAAVIVLLYVRAPAEQIASALPIFNQARVALRRIAALSMELQRSGADLDPETAPEAEPRPARISSIALRGVTYVHQDEAGQERFRLGPIDLTIQGGEMVFLVGQNGSGKTTLIKLLLGLYGPREGEILHDGSAVTSATRDGYRQLFSTVFSDYFLFDDLAYDVPSERAEAHLARFGLADMVRIEGGRFSTTDLSTGQRKRLALVHAYLEDRPVIVTDEWAADQDPEFRRLFYEELLPELKAQGRTLIVISHDDRYFHLADRVLHLELGRLG